jgi:hypothetical protein
MDDLLPINDVGYYRKVHPLRVCDLSETAKVIVEVGRTMVAARGIRG